MRSPRSVDIRHAKMHHDHGDHLRTRTDRQHRRVRSAMIEHPSRVFVQRQPAEARERLASLSNAEVARLNEKIDQLPAGADGAGEILGIALVVFLILLITDILCLTKVFKFTRCSN